MKRIFFATLLLLSLAGCPDMEVRVQSEPMPRGFSQPGSPFPYNSPGW